MNDTTLASVTGKIKVTDKVMHGFYKMLEKDNIKLEDILSDSLQLTERQDNNKIKNNNLKTSSAMSENHLYRIMVNDGWFQLDRSVYRKMQEYFSTTEYYSISDFFEKTGIRSEKVSRIVTDKNLATIFNEEMAIAIYTFDEYFVLSNYKSYRIIDENEDEFILNK